MNRYLLIPLTLLTACAVDELDLVNDPTEVPELPEDPEMPTTTISGPPRQGMETQGRYILGSALDPLDGGAGRHFSVLTTGTNLGGAPRTVEFFGLGALRIQGKTTLADDLVLPGAAGGELRIDLARRAVGVTLYRLQYRATPAGAWTDPCMGAEAVPLLGTFSTAGLHEDTGGQISFACADGVAFKCFDWGYRPGGIRAAESWQIHQACTRMARADYCATGTPHTHEGTLISIFDDVGINPEPPATFYGLDQWTPPVDRMYFEAGWRGEAEPAVCLSKLRWQGLPLGGYCPLALPDPRVDVNADFCDDLISTCADEHTTGCLASGTKTKLFNASRYADLALHVWKLGDDRVSTIDGYYGDPAVTPPLRPYQGQGVYQWVAADGLLLRSLPDSVLSTEVIDVELMASGNDRVYLPITAKVLLPAHTSLGWRGKAFIAARGGTAPLTLYQHPTTGDTLTTTLAAPAGYVSLGTVAHVATFDQPE